VKELCFKSCGRCPAAPATVEVAAPACVFAGGIAGFIRGGTLDHNTGGTVEDCESRCQQNESCRAFHFRADTQECGLKSSAASVTTAAAWQRKYMHYTKVC